MIKGSITLLKTTYNGNNLEKRTDDGELMKEEIYRIKCAPQKNVVVIGDIMLDEYLFGETSRISPEAPVQIVKEHERSWCLGGAANVAANCLHVGLATTLIGIVGNDHNGRKIERLMLELHLATDGVIHSNQRQTTRKQRIMVGRQQLLRVDAESEIELSSHEMTYLANRIDKLFVPGGMILISDYGKGMLTKQSMDYIRKRARALGCTILVDPKGPDFEKYYGIDILKPNLKEFREIENFLGLPSGASIEHNGRQICKRLGIKALVVTMGDRGIQLISQQEHIVSPAVRREIYDLTGAGDTVFAFLALGLLHECSYDTCLQLANTAASVAISHLKTYAVSLDELIDRQIEPSEKVFSSWASLKIELDWLRADGRKVVFTNGCFDIMHSGHINTLKQAKKYGDILVVGLNTDSSVQRLKGPARPLNMLDERAAVLAALGCVDFVVAFDQDTPFDLIDYLRPDVLVKGGDYTQKTIVGADIVTARGGTVEIIPYIEGRSTTAIIKRASGTTIL